MRIKCSGLPHLRVLFLSNDRLLAAGHDCNPCVLVRKGTQWIDGIKIDDERTGSKAARPLLSLPRFATHSVQLTRIMCHTASKCLHRKHHTLQLMVRDTPSECIRCCCQGQVKLKP